jgi:hypothetical protein
MDGQNKKAQNWLIWVTSGVRHGAVPCCPVSGPGVIRACSGAEWSHRWEPNRRWLGVWILGLLVCIWKRILLSELVVCWDLANPGRGSPLRIKKTPDIKAPEYRKWKAWLVQVLTLLGCVPRCVSLKYLLLVWGLWMLWWFVPSGLNLECLHSLVQGLRYLISLRICDAKFGCEVFGSRSGCDISELSEGLCPEYWVWGVWKSMFLVYEFVDLCVKFWVWSVSGSPLIA